LMQLFTSAYQLGLRNVVEVVSRAVTIFDNRFTNITIYEMRHFTLIIEKESC